MHTEKNMHPRSTITTHASTTSASSTKSNTCSTNSRLMCAHRSCENITSTTRPQLATFNCWCAAPQKTVQNKLGKSTCQDPAHSVPPALLIKRCKQACNKLSAGSNSLPMNGWHWQNSLTRPWQHRQHFRQTDRQTDADRHRQTQAQQTNTSNEHVV